MVNSKDRIIIAGDWTIDQYLFLNKHYSMTSSNPGLTHHIISTNGNNKEDLGPKLSLCGAGYIARIIMHEWKRNEYVALGRWHESDGALFENMLIYLVEKNKIFIEIAPSFRRIPPKIKSAAKIKMVNISKEPKDQITRHVSRQYGRNEDGDILQLSRVDRCEYQYNISGSSKIPSDKQDDTENAHKIIIFDRGHNYDLNNNIIMDLIKRNTNCDWYCRTKNHEAGWLQTLLNTDIHDSHIKLLLIGPESISDMNPTKTLFDKNKRHIFPKIFNTIKKIQDYNNEIELLVLVSYCRQIIIKVKDKIYFVSPDRVSKKEESGYLGWTSALYAKFITRHEDINSKSKRKRKDDIVDYLESIINEAIKNAREPYLKNKKSIRVSIHYVGKWNDLKNNYTSALNTVNCGIISKEGKLQLDIPYAYSSIDGYIACVKEKRETINTMVRGLKNFRDNSGHTVSYLVKADPGSGKSFLAKKIAENFDFIYLNFDITQMVRREDLVDLFDRIASEQVRNPKKPILVLIDEVNAPLNSDHVYSAFLAPMEDLQYRRGEEAHNLKPCAWIFITTGIDSQMSSHSSKYNDFKSRITDNINIDISTIIKRNPNDKSAILNRARLEQVYYGARMVKKKFSDVDVISRKILRYFYDDFDPEEAPFRKIKNAINSFGNVTDSINLMNCCDRKSKYIKRCPENDRDNCPQKSAWRYCEKIKYERNKLKCPEDGDDNLFVKIIT